MGHRIQRSRNRQSIEGSDAGPPSSVSERGLVQGLIAGREHAWRELNARYGSLVRRCIVRVIGRSSSEDDIREVFALLLMQLIANDMHRLRIFDPDRGTRFRSWIALLATHCARDFIRMSRRDRERAPLSEAEGVACDRPSPLEHAESRERAELLASALDAFPPRDRELVSLYLGEELAPEQIAERMHISVKTVYSKTHKIKARLSAMLSSAGPTASKGASPPTLPLVATPWERRDDRCDEGGGVRQRATPWGPCAPSLW